jgi:hypothetical protein
MYGTYVLTTGVWQIGRTTNTLQNWDRKGILKAHRSPTNQRYYTMTNTWPSAD